MKARKNTKTHHKSRTHTKSRTKAPTRHRQKTSPPAGSTTATTPIPAFNMNAKACQEVEIGDIGGFGSTEELEEHQKRCNETATEFCSSCGRNLCRNHYDILHRDHDTASHQSVGPTSI